MTNAKSSISHWVCDIPLTAKQIKRLKSNQDRGRAKAAQHPNSPKQKWARIRNGIINDSMREVPSSLSRLELKILGTALYWAEGYNAIRNCIMFSNSDPTIIKIMMRFLKEVCEVPHRKIKGRVNIHPHLNVRKAERFWVRVTGISRKNFNKPLLSTSRASKQKKDALPLGTFNIIVCGVAIASKIKGWIKGLTNWAVGAAG